MTKVLAFCGMMHPANRYQIIPDPMPPVASRKEEFAVCLDRQTQKAAHRKLGREEKNVFKNSKIKNTVKNKI
uniref:Uncharacterized protein n=1 Tax=Anguilla anguilla TaxID=7936 RepID=A0A0E9WVF9_ANGAN